ncbi:MAG: sterol desaturase family protein [Gammaproteobacteria bacterium]|nr:sterol desaturase family protein [Gammaproteobacteria bacterium]
MSNSGVTILIRYGFYPVLALLTLIYLIYELGGPVAQIGSHYGIYLAFTFLLMVFVEARYALSPQWRMTRNTFFRRDLPFLILGGATAAVANFFATQVVTAHAIERGGFFAQLPIVPGVILCILVTDLLWYWLHRWCHEARGPLGRFLWRVHVVHHLPTQLYVLMHAVLHPINVVFVRAILTVPTYFLGFSPEVAFATSVLTGFQGVISHFNVDIRVGWLNYLLVGTEVHRYHHSAAAGEAKNFAAVVPIWDQLFGTFAYRPGEMPEALGVANPDLYPRDTQIVTLLLEPLRRSSYDTAPPKP